MQPDWNTVTLKTHKNHIITLDLYTSVVILKLPLEEVFLVLKTHCWSPVQLENWRPSIEMVNLGTSFSGSNGEG